MKCIYCGHEVNSEITLCPNCGKQLKITKELIEKAIQGNQEAITELYNATYNKIYHTVKAMVKDDDTVLDIVQDSYIKGFQSLKQLEKPENFLAWMKRIAVNKTKDYLKKNKPILFTELANEDDEIDFIDERTEHLPEALIDQKETTRLINEILDALSDEQRLVIGMFYYEQMSVKEIANVLECSENTVKSRLNYGRKKIELQVRELEKKGTKLYSLAPVPFLLWLFKCAEIQESGIPSAAVFEAIKLKITSGTVSSVVETAATEVVAKSVLSGGFKTVAGVLSKTIAGKVIAGILAVSVAVGGFAVVSSVISGKNDESAMTDNIVKTTESILLPTNSLIPTATPESTLEPTPTPEPTSTPKPTPEPIVELSLGEYISVSYSGYNGDGVVQISFNEEDFFTYARTLWTFDELEVKMSDLQKIVDRISFESDKSTELSNGDSYTVNIIFDEALAAELGFSFTNVSKTFLVEGVAEKTVIDPFNSDIFEYRYRTAYDYPNEEPYPYNEVRITYYGISPDISISIDNYYDDANPLSMIEYTLDKCDNLKNGDSVILTASFKDDVYSSAYELMSTSMMINIEGRPSYVDDFSQLNSEAVSYIQNEITYYFSYDAYYEYPILKLYDGSHYETNEIIPGTNEWNAYGAVKFLDSEFISLNPGRCIYPFIIEVNDVVLNPIVDYELDYDLDLAPIEDFPVLYGYFILEDFLVTSSGNISYSDYLNFELGGMYEDKQYMNQAISGMK